MRLATTIAALTVALPGVTALNRAYAEWRGNNTVDALIVGAGPAGLAIATGLARQRHSAIVFDSNEFRNREATHVHNVVGFDHVSPALYRKKARRDLEARYGDLIRFRAAKVQTVRRLESGLFEARDTKGTTYRGRKLALAHGVHDILPAIKGYKECWPQRIFHCLFCEGYEERDQTSAGILYLDPTRAPESTLSTAYKLLQLVHRVRIYTNGDKIAAVKIRKVARNTTVAHLVHIYSERIESLGRSKTGVVVSLAGGPKTNEAFLFHAPPTRVNGEFHTQLNLTLAVDGTIETSGANKETAVHGVFVAGDAGSNMKLATYALGQGAMVAGGIAAQLEREWAEGSLKL